MGHRPNLAVRFPPSLPCRCDTCVGYCRRPGWWTVAEARFAIEAGYGGRMAAEPAPDRSYAVLAPATPGREMSISPWKSGLKPCIFFRYGLCVLFGTGLQPLECRFCHHERRGQGLLCHQAIGAEWRSSAGRRLIERWLRIVS
ncbi:hypothetical protein [Salinispira pacifica]